MGNSRNTGYLQNVIKVDSTGSVSFVSGSTTLATISTSGQFSGSSAVLSSSYSSLASTASYVTLAQTASYVANAVAAQTASYASTFTVGGTLTAQTLVVQTITSSIDYITGSTRFGSSPSNTHTFTGSIYTSGSLTITGSTTILGSVSSTSNVNGASATFNGFGINQTPTSAGTGANYVRFTNTGNDFYIGQEGSTAGGFFTGTVAYDNVIYVGKPINFIISGGSKVYIDGSGNVGIGLTSPGAKLDVANGGIRITETGVSSFTTTYSSGKAQFSMDSAGTDGFYFRTYTGGSYGDRLVIKAAGNVGIGTTNPDNTYQGLTIVGSNPSLRLKGDNTSAWTWIEFVNSSGTNNFSMGVNQTQPLFGIKAGAGMDSVNFSMNSSGNVGIGTTNPNGQLSGTKGLSIVDATNAALGLSNSTNHWLNYLSGTTYRIWNNSVSETMTITLAGNVGIGTTNPGATLPTVSPNNGWTYASRRVLEVSSTTTDGNSGIFLRRSDLATGLDIWSDNYFGNSYIDNRWNDDAGTIVFRTKTAGTPVEAMKIAGSGKIGINTGASTYSQINVGGSLMVNRSKYNFYQESFTGNSTYWHMKTNLWGGGSPNGNTSYTMSLFKGYLYPYSSAAVYEGAVGFHNWNGIIYNLGTTGNLFSNVYISSDGYVVLVSVSGAGEAGITIDWHQAYNYTFREAYVTAAKLYGATSGGY